jgi:hypothetical protein
VLEAQPPLRQMPEDKPAGGMGGDMGGMGGMGGMM